MQDEAQPMLRVMVQVTPQKKGGVKVQVGVLGATEATAPIANTVVSAVCGAALRDAGLTRGQLFSLATGAGRQC